MNLQEMLGDAYKEGMTVDEINEALANYEMPKDNSAEIAKLKESVSRANSEAKKFKDELNAKLSEEERRVKEEAEARDKMEKELEELRKEKSVSSYKAKFLENGYDAELANQSAEALVGGDFNKVFSLLGTHLSNLEKKFKAENINNMPKPNGGSDASTPITKKEFEEMSYQKRAELLRTQPEVYKQFTGGN